MTYDIELRYESCNPLLFANDTSIFDLLYIICLVFMNIDLWKLDKNIMWAEGAWAFILYQ